MRVHAQRERAASDRLFHTQLLLFCHTVLVGIPWFNEILIDGIASIIFGGRPAHLKRIPTCNSKAAFSWFGWLNSLGHYFKRWSIDVAGCIIKFRPINNGKRLGDTFPKETNHCWTTIFSVFDFDLDQLVCIESILCDCWKFNILINFVHFILVFVHQQFIPNPQSYSVINVYRKRVSFGKNRFDVACPPYTYKIFPCGRYWIILIPLKIDDMIDPCKRWFAIQPSIVEVFTCEAPKTSRLDWQRIFANSRGIVCCQISSIFDMVDIAINLWWSIKNNYKLFSSTPSDRLDAVLR